MAFRNLSLSICVAALLACGVARDLSSGATAGAAACTSCHGDAARSGSALSRAAPATGAHVAHVERSGVACGSCHVVPSDALHSNGAVEVTFSGVAKAKGATPSFAGGTCSGVYCHGGAGSSVSWSGGPLACSGCHGAPPATHVPGSTTCSGCHSRTVKPDGTIDVAGGLHANGTIDGPSGGGAYHPPGWEVGTVHGADAKQALASCQGCHGIALDGGSVGVSCATCHTGGADWIRNCTFCHGAKSASYSDADLAKAAPPRGTRGETATSERAVGAHQKHLSGGSIGPPVACSECHAVPGDLSHLDGTAAVAFGPAAKRDAANPTWNGTTCASTYCHGRFTGGVNAGQGVTMSWTSTTQVICSSCHGAPPSTGRHSRHSGRSCGDCHPGTTSSAVNRTTHLDGTKQVGNRITSYNASTRSCTNSCHGNETW